MEYIRDCGTSRIISEVSLDVLDDDSQIFHDCNGPFKRTMRLIGDTIEFQG
jgi:hypothetical protein